jgi:hypothetical protein
MEEHHDCINRLSNELFSRDLPQFVTIVVAAFLGPTYCLVMVPSDPDRFLLVGLVKANLNLEPVELFHKSPSCLSLTATRIFFVVLIHADGARTGERLKRLAWAVRPPPAAP